MKDTVFLHTVTFQKLSPLQVKDLFMRFINLQIIEGDLEQECKDLLLYQLFAHSYKPTPCSRVPLSNLTVFHVIKKFPTLYYGT
jgi:hypothetical protein